MIYICSPFSHKNKAIEEDRYLKAEAYSVHLLRNGRIPFSPIVYCYPIHLRHRLPGSFDFWKSFNEGMMSAADELHVLMLDGWKDSRGVQGEIAWWKENRYDPSIHYIEGAAPWLETTNIG